MIERHGPIVYIESTTIEEIFAEDANRVLLLSADESPQQNRRVIESMAAAASLPEDEPGRHRIIEKHHALQLMLRRVRVTVPFANLIGQSLPASSSSVRRAFGHVLNLVKAVALLFQCQRGEKLKHGALIEATLHDYAIARRLVLGPLGRVVGNQLPPSSQQVVEDLWLRFETAEFTTTDAAGAINRKSRNSTATLLRGLNDVGAVELVRQGSGQTPSCWRMNHPPDQGNASLLPLPQEIDRLIASEEEVTR